MSHMLVDYRSGCLSYPAKFHLFLPEGIPSFMPQDMPRYDRPPKTLFLLHGYSADGTDWLYSGNAAMLSLTYNLAIVLPDGGVNFYLDGKGTGRAHGRFIGQELPEFLRKTFGLAAAAEDTFIGGLSMGGFGAIHTALAYPDTFGCAIGLSSALIVRQVIGMTRESHANDVMADYDYYVQTFGEPSELKDSPNNPETLIKALKANGAAIPRLYMACGTEDFLLERNREFRDFLLAENVPVSYHEGPGAHDWTFWNAWSGPAIQWALGGE